MYGLKDTNYVAFHIGALVFYIRIWKTQDFLSAGSDKEKVPQAYVLIMLTSGLYILNVKNQSGKIYAKKKGDFRQIYTEKGKNGTEHTYLFKNPLEESRYFENQIRKRLTEETVPIQSLAVFPQKSEIIWEQEEDAEIPVIHRKQLFEWIKTDFEVNQGRLAEKKIDGIYQELAEESIAAEKEM